MMSVFASIGCLSSRVRFAVEWLSFTTAVPLLGLITLCYSLVSTALKSLFKYGKTRDVPKSQTSIPKRWFFHFYVFATCFYSFLLYATVVKYATGAKAPLGLSLLLDAFVGTNRRATVDATSVAIAMVLMFAQVVRRLYECTRLSIYSRRGRMTFFQYLCGYCFYFGVGLSLLAEAQGFNDLPPKAIYLRIQPNHVIGVILFLFASLVQFKSHVILARLRLESNGKVISYGHSIPRGFCFELVSCPHYLAEILIYFSLSVVFGGRSVLWWLVCTFVLANQVIMGIFNHNWYRDRFHDYPKQRKAVFPFLI